MKNCQLFDSTLPRQGTKKLYLRLTKMHCIFHILRNDQNPMIVNIRFIQFIAVVTLSTMLSASLIAQNQLAYDRGLEELDSGNITDALDLWYSSYMTDEVESVDSRIGFEFIRVATEYNLNSYYQPATEMYFKALINGDGDESRVAIRQEIERLRAIVGDGIYRQWMEWLDRGNENLGSDIRGFWVQKDPTPAHEVNERLIEHWERIAFAKQHYRKNNSTPYGTDDRALIYIRYGEPDRKSSGILTLQSENIKPWLQRQLNPGLDPESESGIDDDTPAGSEEQGEMLQDAIYEFHQYPEYEIWIYDHLSSAQKEPIFYLFGTDVHSDEFKQQASIDDFIPNRAFTMERNRGNDSADFTRAGITPALILQLLYYEQLVRVDSFFEDRLNTLRERVLEQGMQALREMDNDFKAESRLLADQRKMQVPQDMSSYEDIIPRIPLQVYQYRFLDDELSPTIVTFIETSAQEAFLIDYHRNRGRGDETVGFPNGVNLLEELPTYELKHTLQSYDRRWALTNLMESSPPLFYSRLSPDSTVSSYFQLPHIRRDQMAASVQLNNHDPESRTLDESPFAQEVRGWNKLQFRQPKPLTSHPDTLEVADLVLGYPDSLRVTEPFTFRVANDQIIPFGETLLLHFEVYNLARLENGFTQFELTYRILPVDDAGNILQDQTAFILTLNFINEEQHVFEDLEIETADLNPGLYQLIVQIVDMETDQSKKRSIRFEVMD